LTKFVILRVTKFARIFFPTNQIEWASINLMAAGRQFVGAKMFF
jgi:hypothetical protein